MKKLAMFIGLLLFVTVPARPQSKNIHENVDPYTGLHTIFIEVSTRTCPGDPSPGLHDPEVHLLFTAMQGPDNTVAYMLSPELDHADYTLSLRPSGTMDTLIDGVPGGFTTGSGSTTTHYAGDRSYQHETIPFTVTPADIFRLSTAESFQFRINGPRQDVQRCTDAKRMKDLSEFLGVASTLGPPHLDGQIAAGGPPGPFTENVNSSTNLKTLTFANIPTQPCAGDPVSPPADVRLAISATQRSDGGVWYFLTTELYDNATLDLVRGGTLEVQMDGKTSVFHTINGSKRSYATEAGGRSIPREATAFHVHQPNLIALSKASKLEFRVNGPNGALHRCINADQLTNLTAFIDLAARYEPSHLAASAPSH